MSYKRFLQIRNLNFLIVTEDYSLSTLIHFFSMHPFSTHGRFSVRFSVVFKGQRKGALRMNGKIYYENQKYVNRKSCCSVSVKSYSQVFSLFSVLHKSTLKYCLIGLSVITTRLNHLCFFAKNLCENFYHCQHWMNCVKISLSKSFFRQSGLKTATVPYILHPCSIFTLCCLS